LVKDTGDFYDKIEELKREESLGKVPKHHIVSKNILRFEYRILKNPKRLFKKQELRLVELSRLDLFKQLPDIWEKKYFAIDKIKIPTMKGVANTRDFFDYYFIEGLFKKNDKETAINQIHHLEITGIFNQNQRKYAVSWLNQSLKNRSVIDSDELLTELNNKVRNTKRHFLEYPSG